MPHNAEDFLLQQNVLLYLRWGACIFGFWAVTCSWWAPKRAKPVRSTKWSLRLYSSRIISALMCQLFTGLIKHGFLLIVCFCITFTVNIYVYFNLEVLHILEKYCVGTRDSFLIHALKMACPVKQFLFSSSTAYRNELFNTTCAVFLSYQKVFCLPSFEGFILIFLLSIFCFSDTHFVVFVFPLVLCTSVLLSFTTSSSFLLSCSPSSKKKVGNSQRKKKKEVETVWIVCRIFWFLYF